MSFRIAAIRETFEESGILLARPKGRTALVDATRAGEIEAAHRADLNERKITFLKVLTDNGMVLALDDTRALRALDHAGGHAEALRHLVFPGRGAAGSARRP